LSFGFRFEIGCPLRQPLSTYFIKPFLHCFSCRRASGAGWQILQAARGTQTFCSFVNRAEQQILAARGQTESRAFGSNEIAEKFSQRLERFIRRNAGQSAHERGRPASEVFAEEFFLRVAAECDLILIQLIFESIGFLAREHGHKLQFHTDVVGSLGRAIRNLQSKRSIKRREVGEAMRLKERVRFEIAIFDFVERTIAARCVAKSGDVGDLKGIEPIWLQALRERRGRTA
jgi:hypothetical protein